MSGFTKIDNSVLDSLISSNLSSAEIKIAVFVLRKTLGYNKVVDEISYSQFIRATKLSRQTVATSLKNLQLVKIIRLVKRGSSVSSSNLWEVNTDVDKWQLVNRGRLVKSTTPTSQVLHKQLVKSTRHTKEIITKEINTKEHVQESREFLEFWNLYPRKQSRVDAEKKYIILVKDGYHDEIIKGLQRYLRYWKQHKTEPRYIPLPTSWLNAQRWNDDLDLKPVYQERKLDLPPGWVPPPPPKRASSDLLKLSRKRFEELKRTGLFLNTT